VRGGARVIGLVVVVVFCLAAGLSAGAVPLPLSAVWEGLWNSDSGASAIVRDLRAPRVLLAFLVGGSLGICGAALQAMIRNPLAEPYLLGLSSGAGLGAVIAIATRAGSAWAVPLAAFVGALSAVVLVYRLSLVSGRRLDPHVLLLSGVVVGAFAGALMSAVMVLSDAPGVRNAFLWLLGGFGTASWRALAVFSVYAALPLAVLLYHARALDLIALGDEPAHHLGADVHRLRRVVYLCTALLTAASVATCGIIGFVGLVVPHAVRIVYRPLHRTLLPIVFLVGGCFLVLADVVSRTVVRPLELPVGVVTALIGVPLFALLLRRTLA
jgi:iron complex transport system permease protein